jgi:hypothetical protein
MSKLAWSKNTPAEPGLYLRSNPAMRTVVHQNVVEGDGRLLPRGGLYVLLNGKFVQLDNWIGSGKMWWFGPIPEVPEKIDG